MSFKVLGLCFLTFLARSVNADCRDLTLDACDYQQAGPFESSKGLDQDLCQKFCDQIYAGKCKFFIFDGQEQICQLFDYESGDYVSSCSIIAGTPQPDIASCNSTDDQCAVRLFNFYHTVKPRYKIARKCYIFLLY